MVVTNRIYQLNGVRYLSTGQVAKLLNVSQRTFLRWVARVGKPGAPKPLKDLVWIRDPASGFTYFRENSVLALRQRLQRTRPVRVQGTMGGPQCLVAFTKSTEIGT